MKLYYKIEDKNVQQLLVELTGIKKNYVPRYEPKIMNEMFDEIRDLLGFTMFKVRNNDLITLKGEISTTISPISENVDKKRYFDEVKRFLQALKMEV